MIAALLASCIFMHNNYFHVSAKEPFKNRPLWRMIKNVTSYGRPIYRREIDPKHKSIYLSAIYAGSQWFVTFERGRINDS